MKWIVLTSRLETKNGAGPGFKPQIVTPPINKDDILTEYDRKQVGDQLWIRHSADGAPLRWSMAVSNSATNPKTNMKVYELDEPVVEDKTDTSTAPSPEVTPADKDQEAALEAENDGSGYQPDVDLVISSDDWVNQVTVSSDFYRMQNIVGVFGLPYQFLPSADVRLDPDDTYSEKVNGVGQEYAENIISRMPLLLVSPGRADFMTKFSKANKEGILQKLIDVGRGNETASVSNLLDNSNGRYYTFRYDDIEYYKFVNPMCRAAARFLELQDYQINGVNLDNVDWRNMTKQRIQTLGDFGTIQTIPFYINSETSISESFSNGTTQSMIASTVNSISDMGKEINFLLGYGQSATGVQILENDAEISSNIAEVQGMISKMLGNGNFLSNLSEKLTTVAAGGRMMFPEIWADSSFSRNYSISQKLVSPSSDKLSIYLNILVPLFHWMGLVGPQTLSDDPNSYANPFIVRAIYKGFFNIDTGMITSMGVDKGGECQWTPDGLPTSIDLNIEVKDLYAAMALTKTENTSNWNFDTLNNMALMDYIANLCGINVYKPEIARSIDMWATLNFGNRARDVFRLDIFGGIQNAISSGVVNFFR